MTRIDERRGAAPGHGLGPTRQWVAMFLAPAAYFTHLQLGYVLVFWSCQHDNELPLHVVSVLTVLIAAAGTVAAWRLWSAHRRTDPGEEGGEAPRVRFLAVCGFVMSVFFTVLLLVQWLAGFVIRPCQ